MKIVAGTIVGIVLASSVAFAGGNPDEEDFGMMTREALPNAQPLAVTTPDPAPDQYQIQREIEAEVRKGWVKMNLSAPADNDSVNAEPVKPVIIARAEPNHECAWLFRVAAEALGGECFRDSNFHNPGVVGHSTEREVTTETTVDKQKRSFKKSRKGYYAAKRYARSLHKQGYKVRIGFRKGKIKVVGKKVTTITFVTLTKVRNDAAGSSGGGTAADSNGMRGDDRDSGNW